MWSNGVLHGVQKTKDLGGAGVNGSIKETESLKYSDYIGYVSLHW